MFVRSLALTDFRGYTSVDVCFSEQLTAVVGANGQGKTNLLEAIGFAAGIGSMRGAPDDAMVRNGADQAIIRCEIEGDDGREILIECELARAGRNRIQVNRQRVKRTRDLAGALVVTVFSPHDLELLKGGPSLRRRWIDDALVALRPRHAALRTDLDRILRQRNAVLRQSRGRLTDEIAITLDVWDAKLAGLGDELRRERQSLLASIGPRMATAYDEVASHPADVHVTYESSWDDGPLAEALASARTNDLRRGASTVGPHRDELAVSIGGLAARTHASQGEQRALALAMRLAADAELRQSGDVTPVLLLDDVFSELDSSRAAALLRALPPGQRILTTASGLPPMAVPDRVLRVHDGSVESEASANG